MRRYCDLGLGLDLGLQFSIYFEMNILRWIYFSFCGNKFFEA